MKILQTIASLRPEAGGPVEAAKQFAQLLAKCGHQVDTATLDAPTCPWLDDTSMNIYALGPSWLNQRYCKNLVPWLQQHASQYDAVIVRGIWQFSSVGVWYALRKRSIPYFVYIHGMLDPWFKRTYPLKHLKKMLYWPWADYKVLRDARAVFFTSEQEKLLARQSFPRYQCREIVVNYGTTAPPQPKDYCKDIFFQKFPQLRGKDYLIFLGRIHPKKGCDLLIQAFSKLVSAYPDYYLLMAGPDQIGWQAQLQKLARQYNCSNNIVWAGMLSGVIKWGALFGAQAFALPSHQENFGIAVAEALACGLPVLISDQVNIWQEIVAYRAGFVAPDTLSGTYESLQRWLELPAMQKQLMCQQSLQCFREKFELERSIENLIQTIHHEIATTKMP